MTPSAGPVHNGLRVRIDLEPVIEWPRSLGFRGCVRWFVFCLVGWFVRQFVFGSFFVRSLVRAFVRSFFRSFVESRIECITLF